MTITIVTVLLLAISYTQPSDYVFVIYKKEMLLHLHRGKTVIDSFKICSLAKNELPKKRAGDSRTPEGLYEISFINRRSASYKTIGISYPNQYDRRRKFTGGSIGIHGKCCSVGCIGMSNPDIDSIFSRIDKYKIPIRSAVLILPSKSIDSIKVLQRRYPTEATHYQEMLKLLSGIERGILPRAGRGGYE